MERHAQKQNASTRRRPAIRLAVLALLLFSAAQVTAATFTVINTNNSGAGSLRQAVLNSNAAAGSDTIVFDPAVFSTPQTITLASVITINPATGDSLTITGPGANLLTVSGNNAADIFFVSAGDTAAISGVTLAQAGGSAIDNQGTLSVANAVFASNMPNGGISTRGPLTVSNSTFNSNQGGAGGAIGIILSGSATVSNSTFTTNTASYGGAIYTAGSLTVIGCTFTDNVATSGSATGQGGGAIHSNTSGTISLSDSTFTGNDEVGGSGGGGAIRNRGGTWTITNSTFSNNTAVNGGGAIQNADVMSIIGSSLTGNVTSGNAVISRGGAISAGGKLTIASTKISGNFASREGGGIFYSAAFFSGEGYFLTITNSTISGNTSQTYGGGLYQAQGPGPRVTISGSNISGNRANVPKPSVGYGEGGGIWTDGELTIENTTISGNWADDEGGGIFAGHSLTLSGVTVAHNTGFNNSSESTGGIYNSGGLIILRNTIVANNTGLAAQDVRGTFLSQGYNLIEDTSQSGGGHAFIDGDTATNITGLDPNLGPLADNGGPTHSHALLAGSPALDKGKSFGMTTDQRGGLRPHDMPAIGNASGGDGADIGAYEVQAIAVLAVLSRKTHGSAGTFDIPLPLTDEPGVECRSSGGNHSLVFTFTNNLVSGSVSLTTGVGSVQGSPSFDGKTMMVNLTGVADVQRITVTLSNVTDEFSQVLPSTAVSVNMLVGDINGSKVVNASDIGAVKAQSGLPVTNTNFRADVAVSGSITASDIGLVKSRSGASVP
jgi:predicted outer membrane repeat protein